MFCFFTVQTIDKLERDRLLLFLNALIKHKVAVYFRFFTFPCLLKFFFLSNIGEVNIKELYLCTFIYFLRVVSC